MALGMEAGLGPEYFVLDVDPAPPPKKWAWPQFLAMSSVVKRLDGLR